MKSRNEIIKSVGRYLTDNIENFGLKSRLAYIQMDAMRCPVPEALSNEIQRAISDWVEDYGKDFGVESEDDFWNEFLKDDLI